MKNNPLVAEVAGKLVFGRDRVLVSTRGSKSFGKMGRRTRAALFEYWAGALVAVSIMPISQSFVSTGQGEFWVFERCEKPAQAVAERRDWASTCSNAVSACLCANSTRS